jgi:two-component sensor histidine kinase
LALISQQARALVLALHELATNAMKDGALSHPSGRVDLTWAAEENGMVEVRWSETGGPHIERAPVHES